MPCCCQCRRMQGPGRVQLLTVQHPTSASHPTCFPRQLPQHSPRRCHPSISGAAACSQWAGSPRPLTALMPEQTCAGSAIRIPACSLPFHAEGCLLPCPPTPEKAPVWYALQLLPNRGEVPSLTDISFEIRATQQALDSQCVNTCSSAPPGVLGVLPRPAGSLWLINAQPLSNKSLLLSRGETPNAVSPALLPSGGSTCIAKQK